MQVRKFVFAIGFAGLASLPVWGGFSVALETPRAAVELAPLVLAPPQAARANPTGFEAWALSQHRAARDGLSRRPPGPTCVVSVFGNAPL